MTLTCNLTRMTHKICFAIIVTIAIVATSFNSSFAQAAENSPTDDQSVDYQSINVATFDVLRKDASYKRIDVRTSDEVALNNMGAHFYIDFSDVSFVSELKKLDRNQSYLVISEDGVDGAKAAQKMMDLGFKNVSNLEGGFAQWAATDRPPE